MNTAFTTTSALFGHTNCDTARLVGDYPYGYRLRTQIRYWIETNARHGDRFMAQTLNPKTGRWNKPKASTYSPVMAMYVDGEGHVTHTAVSTYSKPEWIERFRAVVGEHLNDLQQAQLATVIAVNKVMEHVTFTCKVGRATDEEKAEQAVQDRRIAQAVAVETHQAARDLSER